MKHYIDITLLPSDDIGVHFLWPKVMMQIHLALVEMKNQNNKTPIGISFPQYKEAKAEKESFIGHKIRLIAQQSSDLQKLNIEKWLARLLDYVHIKAIADIPNTVKSYAAFSRVVKAGSPNKHIRRRMKRKGETQTEASKHFANYAMPDNVKKLPFINMKSLGGGDDFKLVIKKTTKETAQGEYLFSTYGLNKDIALPLF